MPAVGVVLALFGAAAGGCSRRVTPVARPVPPATAAPPAATARPVPSPPGRVEGALPVPPEPIAENAIAARPLDELNRESPFAPVFFDLDSAELSDAGRAVVVKNAALLRNYPTWTIVVEGHCDERGSAEYNLALGERRAAAAMAYLVSIGIAADRVRAVSYGKEFPFDPGHDEAAWAKNRRAHFVITSR